MSDINKHCHVKSILTALIAEFQFPTITATITANCLHPATYMATTMVRQSGVTPISTVEEGAEAILNLVLSEAPNGRTGVHFSFDDSDGLLKASFQSGSARPIARGVRRIG